MGQKQNKLDFPALVDAIHRVHQQCAAYAGKAVNVSLTVRNWIIGRHISEFELHGADRAVYGERLLEALSKELRKVQVSSSGFRQLYGYLAFYRAYPKILRTLSAEFRDLLPAPTIQSDSMGTPLFSCVAFKKKLWKGSSMPRRARIDAPGALHHIICRGIERRKIFWVHSDREDFIERLDTTLGASQTACYAWALLPNHFHLLLRTGNTPIARVMRHDRQRV
jgi:hypothetical protein